ncbi:hypothetical protein J6590_094712 [Homalodisca vitripennis]|nr:hypothetical protein J6590_094712 [Homalodisca vitripennis]
MNRMGPSTDPCETPLVIGLGCDLNMLVRYIITLRGGSSAGNLHRILMLQKQALRIMAGSGWLEFDEFCILASRFLTEDETGNDCEEELREAFRLYDKEGQGYITTDVLKEIFRELDHSITEDDLENMIEEIDADGSGTVDFEERRMMNTWIALAEGGRKTNDEYLDCSSSILSYLEQMRAVPVVNFLIYPPCRRHPSIGAYGYASGYLTSYSSRCDTASPGAFLNAGMGSLEILRYKESELGGRVGMFRRDRSMGKEAEGCRASIGDVSSPAEIGMYQRKGNEGFRTKCRAMEGVATIK